MHAGASVAKIVPTFMRFVTLAHTSHSTPSTRDLAHVPHSLENGPPMPTGTLSYSLGVPSDVCGVSESLLLQVPGLVY